MMDPKTVTVIPALSLLEKNVCIYLPYVYKKQAFTLKFSSLTTVARLALYDLTVH